MILEKHSEVLFQRGKHRDRLGQIVDKALELGTHEEGVVQSVFYLSAPDDTDTVRLPEPIPNDTVSKNNRGAAFVQGQRYVRLRDLLTAKSTSDLR